MKKFLEYLIQRPHYVLGFLVGSFLCSSVFYCAIKEFFNREEFNTLDWFILLFISLFFTFLLTKRDFQNFLFWKKTKYTLKILRDQLNRKKEEIDSIREKRRDIEFLFSKTKAEEVSLGENISEFLKDHPELRENPKH